MNSLLKLKSELEHFIKKAMWARRENYVLYSVEKSEKYQEMKKELTEGFTIQALRFLRNPEVRIAIDKRLSHAKAFPEHERQFTEEDVNAIMAIVHKYLPDLNEIIDDNLLMDCYMYFANKGGQAALDKKHKQEAKKAAFEAIFNLKNKDIISRLASRSKLLITDINQTTERWLTTQLMAGEENNLDWQEVADIVRTKIPDYYNNRAETIVKTEMANVVNQTEMETAVKNEATTKIWNAAGMNICEECDQNDSEEVNIGDVFPSGDDRPPVHPNCKCLLSYNYPTLGTFANEWAGEED